MLMTNYIIFGHRLCVPIVRLDKICQKYYFIEDSLNVFLKVVSVNYHGPYLNLKS